MNHRRLLLDSNALLRWAVQRALSPETLRIVADRNVELSISVASVWELEIKRQSGKLELMPTIWADMDAHRIRLLDIGLDDALAAARLPPHHSDPFDRVIIAQAMRRDLTIVTSDSAFARYDVALLPA